MESENKKGKIVQADQILNNGEHATYIDKRGDTNYKFMLVWDNGDKGEASAKSSNKQYELNKELTYVKYTRIHNDNTYYSFAKINDPNYQKGTGGGGGGGAKKSPDQEYYILMSVAVETSCITVRDMATHLQRPTDLKECTSLFTKWMLRKIHVNKCNAINVQAALRRAILLIGVDGQGVDSPQTVIIKAEEFYKTINDNVPWQKNLVQKMLSEGSEQNTNPNQNQPAQEESQGNQSNEGMKEFNEKDMA